MRQTTAIASTLTFGQRSAPCVMSFKPKKTVALRFIHFSSVVLAPRDGELGIGQISGQEVPAPGLIGRNTSCRSRFRLVHLRLLSTRARRWSSASRTGGSTGLVTRGF